MTTKVKQRIEQIRQGKVPKEYKRVGSNIIPNSWNYSTFSNLGIIASGLIDPKEYPYYNMQHIGPDNIEKNTGRILETQSASELGLISGKFYFDSQSIVYSKIRPNLNKVCAPDFEGICSADCYSIKPTKNIDRKYLLELMLSHSFFKHAVACSMRTGMPKINQEDLNLIPLCYPKSISEQKEISKILATQNKVIELKEKLIAEKQLQKKYLMQQLLTSRKRLPGFHSAWKKEQLGNLFVERNETNCNNLELLAITGTQGVIPRSQLDLKDNSSEDKSKYRKICVGDIGYNTMRMWQGVSAYSKYEGIVSPAYTILKPKGNINTKYFAYLFKTPEVIFLFYRFSQGLVDDTLNLKYENFKKISVIYPNNIHEQNLIVDILEKADQEIELLNRKIEMEKQKKKALMQLLLTGIVRV